MGIENCLLKSICTLLCCGYFNLSAQVGNCISGSVANGNNDPWSSECYLNNMCELQGNPCQANDVNLTNVFFADATGSPLPTCMPGDIISIYLWGTFDANATRFAVRTNAEVFINSVFNSEINECSFETIAVGQSTSRLLGPIDISCTDVVELQNIWVAWETSTATCATASICKDYPPSKCNQNSVQGIAPVNTNFTSVCGPSDSEFCFSDLTTGGVGPYTYDWNFGDGASSTSMDICHTYTQPGIYTIILKAMDTEGRATERSANINVEDCFALPITLTKFIVSEINRKIHIEWMTSSELNNSHFIIESKTNVSDWENLERVEGQGTTQEKTEYSFSHNIDGYGTYYYRLKQVDSDGEYAYSSIRSIKVDADKDARLIMYTPNPVHDELSITIAVDEKSIHTLLIHDVNGRLIRTMMITEPMRISMNQLPDGVYTMSLIKNKMIVDRQKLVKI